MSIVQVMLDFVANVKLLNFAWETGNGEWRTQSLLPVAVSVILNLSIYPPDLPLTINARIEKVSKYFE